ncbi:MAG: response regulator [Chloroflexi bacterium OHK40]
MSQVPNDPLAILLVEDESGIMGLLRRLMRDLARAYEIVPCTNGRIALDELGRRQVAMVITDYRMPELDGLELTRHVKAARPHLPVLMISAYAYPDLQRRAMEAGVDRFIGKPFTLELLEETIQQLLLPTAP